MSKNMANREVCNAIFRDYATKAPVLYADYANTTTTEVTGESVAAYGGWGHPKRVIFNGERGGTIAFEFQVHPFQLFALMSGAAIDKEASYFKRAVVKATEGGVLTLKEGEIPANKFISVFAYNDDCGNDLGATKGEEGNVTIGANITFDKNVITVSGDGIVAGQEYIVYYERAYAGSGVQKLSITGKTFPKALTIDADTIYKTEDDALIPMILRVYKCQPQTQFTLAHSNTGDPGTITLTCDLMEDENGNMLDLIAIEE